MSLVINQKAFTIREDWLRSRGKDISPRGCMTAREAFLGAHIRAYYGKPQKQLHPTCDHAPLPCIAVRPDIDLSRLSLASDTPFHAPSKAPSNCRIHSMREQWRGRDQTFAFSHNPVAVAINDAGGDKDVARMVLSNEAYGMDISDSKTVIDAQMRVTQAIEAANKTPAGMCSSCGPSSNTAMFRSNNHSAKSLDEKPCSRISVPIEKFRITADDQEKTLCIGEGGQLKWCGPGEFIAISHVWKHGWQGTSEDGICSRTLQMLLEVAAFWKVEYVWLDVAMISNDVEVRANSVNSMHLVYTTAKVTVVSDRLLLAAAAERAGPRELAFLIFLSDWMTRVWTMQEGLLSRRLVFLFGDGFRSSQDLVESILDQSTEGNYSWQTYGAALKLTRMFLFGDRTVSDTIDRVSSMSKERLTTKPIDFVRATYPIFDLKWPRASFSLEEAQEKLLKYLGQDAAILSPLHGPIMPRPFSWAPLSLAGCSGGLAGKGMIVTAKGLYGEWAAWQCTYIGCESLPDRRRDNGHSARVARLTSTGFHNICVKVEGVPEDLQLYMFHREHDLSRLERCTLLLLRALASGQSKMQLLDYYHLVEVESETMTREKYMHRVGSAFGGLMGHQSRLEVSKYSIRGWMQ